MTATDTISLPRDANGNPIQGTYRTLVSGLTTVAASGTPVQLTATSTVCKRIDIVAQFGNTGTVYVGDSSVLASTKQGMPLTQGSSYTAYVNDISSIYVDSTTSGDKVSYIYYV